MVTWQRTDSFSNVARDFEKTAQVTQDTSMIDLRCQMKYTYPAVFIRENVGYSIYFPRFLSGCISQGDDMEEALDMAQDCALHLPV